MASHIAALHSARFPGGYHAGGGLARWLVHLFIWRVIWRAGLALWHLPVFGPVIIVLLVAALVALGLLRGRGGWALTQRRRGGHGHGTGQGPRGW